MYAGSAPLRINKARAIMFNTFIQDSLLNFAINYDSLLFLYIYRSLSSTCSIYLTADSNHPHKGIIVRSSRGGQHRVLLTQDNSELKPHELRKDRDA